MDRKERCMTRSSSTGLVILFIGAAGCGSSASSNPPPSDAAGDVAMDYGQPSDATRISLEGTGGFVPPRSRGVMIAGTTATFHDNSKVGQATLATADVAAMIDALEAVQFLSLDTDYTLCADKASDMATVTIDVALPAGTHMLRHYLGCEGGIFDDLADLEQQIFAHSGLSDWVNGR